MPFYKDTAENRKKGRVGEGYGKDKGKSYLMFSILKEKQKTKPGFKYLVTAPSIEIYGEVHNTRMVNSHIYSKIIKELPESDITVLVEHSTHPELCQLKEQEKVKFTEQIKRSGSEYVFYHTINNPKVNTKCIDNRIVFGYLPAFIENRNINLIDSLEDEEASEDSIKLIKTLLKQYVDMFRVLSENEKYYEVIKDIYQIYVTTLAYQLKIVGLSMKVDPRGFDIVEHTSLKSHKITNYVILIRALSAIADNFKKIASITVDVNIVNIINQTPGNIMLFCGVNHLIRISDLFLENITIYNSDMENIDDFEPNDNEIANIYPISSPVDREILSYLESKR